MWSQWGIEYLVSRLFVRLNANMQLTVRRRIAILGSHHESSGIDITYGALSMVKIGMESPGTDINPWMRLLPPYETRA